MEGGETQRRGVAWQGEARRGKARLGAARRGGAGRGEAGRGASAESLQMTRPPMYNDVSDTHHEKKMGKIFV